MSAADLVSILNAINVPVCFTVLVAGVIVLAIKSSISRSDDKDRLRKHAETMEALRLRNTKEITVARES